MCNNMKDQTGTNSKCRKTPHCLFADKQPEIFLLCSFSYATLYMSLTYSSFVHDLDSRWKQTWSKES